MKKNRLLRVKSIDMSIRDYIILSLMLFLIIVVMIIIKINDISVMNNQYKIYNETMKKTSYNQNTILGRYFEEKIDNLKMISLFPQVYEMDQNTQENFLKNRSDLLKLDQIFIVDTDGKGYYFDEEAIKDQKTEKFFNDIMENDVYISEPYYIENKKTMIVTLCVSIYDETGIKVGVLCGTLDLLSVHQNLCDSNTIIGSESFLIDKNGIYYTDKDMNNVFCRKSIFEEVGSDYSLVSQAIINKSEISGQIIRDGVKCQAIIAPTAFSPNIYIVQSIPDKLIIANMESLNLLQNILIVTILELLGCILYIIFLWRKSNKKIKTDALTGCNSRAAIDLVMHKLQNDRSHDIAIVYMDLNKFKFVNDTYGHDKGDELLCIFSDVINSILGKSGLVGRMGGDEFICIMLDTTKDEFDIIWKKVEEELEKRSKKLDFEYTITSSYGYACKNKDDTTDLINIMNMADEAMYKYKTERKLAR